MDAGCGAATSLSVSKSSTSVRLLRVPFLGFFFPPIPQRLSRLPSSDFYFSCSVLHVFRELIRPLNLPALPNYPVR